MFGILSELIRYVIFMYLVLLMAYAQRDNNVFYNNQFVASHGFNSEDVEDIVTTPPEVLDFMEEVIENGIYYVDEDSEGFFSEGRGYFLQEPRLRQLRILPEDCKAPKIFNGAVRCVLKLDRGRRSAELDTADYGEGWSNYSAALNMTAWMFSHEESHATNRGDHDKCYCSLLATTDMQSFWFGFSLGLHT